VLSCKQTTLLYLVLSLIILAYILFVPYIDVHNFDTDFRVGLLSFIFSFTH